MFLTKSLIWSSRVICLAGSIVRSFIKILAVASASSAARWCFKRGTLNSSARFFSLWFLSFGSIARAIPRVSKTGLFKVIPVSFIRFTLIKPASNLALWATRVAEPANSMNSGKTCPIVRASRTISGNIPVNLWISTGIAFSGLTNREKWSRTLSFLIFTAPISMISLTLAESPVVSRSNTTNSSSASMPEWGLSTIGTPSSTR